MTPETVQQLRSDLKRDEGLRLKPYLDTVGKVSIGYGRNLDDRGISEDEAEFLLAEDVKLVLNDIRHLFPWVLNETQNRQRAFANLLFNLGATKLGKFKNTLAHWAAGQHQKAADGIRASLYAKQVGARAERIAKLVEQG